MASQKKSTRPRATTKEENMTVHHSAALRPVMITTAYKGVFAGLLNADQDLSAKSMPLLSAKMAIFWGTKRGVMELAHEGPTTASKISAAADIPMLHDITAIFDLTPQAWAKWQAA